MSRGTLGGFLIALSLLSIVFMEQLCSYCGAIEPWILLLLTLIVLGAGILLVKSQFMDGGHALGGVFLGTAIVLIILRVFAGFLEIPLWLPDVLIVSAIIAVVSNIDFEERVLGVHNSSVFIFGKAVGSASAGLFVYWIFVKLGILSALLIMFSTPDNLMIASLLLFVVGSVARNFALDVSSSRPARAVRNAISTAFWNMLIVGIIAFILDAANLVGPEWEGFLAEIWRVVGILFVGMILAILIIRVEEYVPHTLAEVKVGREVYSLPRTQSMILPGDIELIVQGGSHIVPLFKGEAIQGAFILGDISYSVELDGKHFRGEADRICIVTEETICKQILGELNLQPTSGILYFDEIFVSAEDALENLRRSLGGEEHMVDLPFIRVHSRGGVEFVKVGPITVIETDRGEYVKVGPIRVQEREIHEAMGLGETAIGISDLDKGWVVISVRGNKVKIWWDDAVILSSPSGISVRRGKVVASVEPREYKLVWRDIVIKVGSNKAKVVAKDMVLKVDPPYIKVVHKGNVIRITDQALAEEIMSILRTNLEDLSRDVIEGRHMDKIISLIQEIREKILRSIHRY